MSSFDSLFPNRQDCYYALFQDVVYEHDNEAGYVFEQGQFKRRNRVTVAKRIKDLAEVVYAGFVSQDSSFSQCKPLIDYPALLAVLTRYSRDIYGFRRISAKIRDVDTGLDTVQRERLEQIILEGAEFGFKVPSERPYIERQASVLLYWFSVLKPFHLGFKSSKNPPPEAYIQAYFNEYFAYFLICVALHTQSVDLVIHENKAVFVEFLNQLHFRNLSRSSLEFFLPNSKQR
ncbi:MAG: hypothetical protein LBT16_12505 [Treponema sp.]|jgi:hypothetical protein|nr:hypothetical protein [Treponema sp.]